MVITSTNINKTPAKSQPPRAAATAAAAITAAGKQAGKPRRGSQPVIIAHPCKVCNENVVEVGIQCDFCESWNHQKCTNLSLTQYNFLSDYPTSNIKWYCADCDTATLVKKSSLDEKYDNQGKQIHDLSKLVIAIEAQTQMMMELLQNQNKKTTEPATATTENNLRATVSELLHEQKELEEKKDNIILFNIPESESDDQELSNIKEVLNHVCPESDFTTITNSEVKRLGQKKDGPDARSRPIKVKIAQAEERSKLLKGARSLKNFQRFQKVGLSRDKTYREILHDREVRDEMTRWRNSGDPAKKDPVYFHGKVMSRTEMNLLKNQQDDQDMAAKTAPAGAGDPAN